MYIFPDPARTTVQAPQKSVPPLPLGEGRGEGGTSLKYVGLTGLRAGSPSSQDGLIQPVDLPDTAPSSTADPARRTDAQWICPQQRDHHHGRPERHAGFLAVGGHLHFADLPTPDGRASQWAQCVGRSSNLYRVTAGAGLQLTMESSALRVCSGLYPCRSIIGRSA